MATVGEDQAPTSNGINGHPTPASSTLDAKADNDQTRKSPQPIDKSESSLESSHLKNQDAFVANQSIADPSTDADTPATDSKPVPAAPAMTSAEEQPLPPTEDTEMRDVPEAPKVQDAPAPETETPVVEEKGAAKSPAEEDSTEQPTTTSEAPKADDVVMGDTKKDDAEKTGATSEQTDSADIEMSGADATADASATAAEPATQATDSTGGDAPSMSNLAIAETQEQSSAPATADTSMTDAPSQPAKVAREREEDDAEERSAKRARTEDVVDAESATATKPIEDEVAVAPAPGAGVPGPDENVPPPREREWLPGSVSDPASENLPVTQYLNRLLRQVVFGGVKKIKSGFHFKEPVQKRWPNIWESYQLRVPKPVDITSIEKNLREDKYANIGEVVNDAFLIYENAVLFNGRTHDVTIQGKQLIDDIFSRMAKIPAIEPPKPVKKDTKSAPTRHAEPRAATNRRESRGNAPALNTAVQQEVVVDTTPSTVAFPAGGTPIIRRDSTKFDNERPKRPVQPPKNRDLPYEVKNSKKKKAQPEMRFCEEVLRELTKSKHFTINQWFAQPVDPVAQGLPTYHKMIKKPMDLSTMEKKLQAGEYNTPKEFESDFNLIVKNCYKFNGDLSLGSPVSIAADELNTLFQQEWKKRDSWIAQHAPPPAPASASSPGDAEEDSDDEAEASEAEAETEAAPATSATLTTLEARLDEENKRFAQMLAAKVPDATLIKTQQDLIGMFTTQIIQEKTRLAEEEKKTKKPSKPKPSKAKKASGAAAAPARKAGGSGGAKKAGAAGGRKGTKARVMGQAEKEVVSESINELEGGALDKAIDIIKKDTHQEETEDGELELDIDQLSQDALAKIYDLILKSLPNVRARVEKIKAPLPSPPAADAPPIKASKPKKHKPMGKAEQESNIEKLRAIKAQFQRTGSGSQEPLPSVEGGQPVKEEDEDSEADSEEE